MAPKKEEPLHDLCVSQDPLFPGIIETPSSEENLSIASDSEENSSALDPNYLLLLTSFQIPLEQTLREILIKSTGRTDLDQVTSVSLRVISADVSLQLLSVHTPLLSELTLDGSIVSSLRDLGCGLSNLKVLKVNRCSLTSLDGMFGLQTLEELYAGGNLLQTVSQCSSLPDLRILDLRSNNLKNMTAVSFLGFCDNLEHLNLEGNENVTVTSNYRVAIKKYMPNLKTLDGVYFTQEEIDEAFPDVHEEDVVEDKDGPFKEIRPLKLESPRENESRGSSRLGGFLPPINSSTSRPNTTGVNETNRLPQITPRSRPSTAREPHTLGRIELPSISHVEENERIGVRNNDVLSARDYSRRYQSAWDEE